MTKKQDSFKYTRTIMLINEIDNLLDRKDISYEYIEFIIKGLIKKWRESKWQP